MTLEEHLGGHNGVTHTDEGALQWAIDNLNVRTMLDVGCGPGGQVELANNIGIDAEGIDGDGTIERYDSNKFIIHDFSTGPGAIDKNYDLAWSCEFVEHVYEQYIPNYVQAMQRAKYLIMTYAPVGATGYHTQEYWIDTMSKYNFVFDESLTKEMRRNSTMGKKKKHQFLRRTGLLFRNEQR